MATLIAPEEPVGPRSEEPWPEFSRTPHASPPSAASAAARRSTGSRGLAGGPARVTFLVALLVVVTIAGIAIGQALEPGTGTSSATSTTTVPRARPPRVRALAWGPLAASVYGTLPVGGDRTGAAITGRTLVVVGGAGSNKVLAGPLGGKLVVVAKLPQRLSATQAFALGGTVYSLGGEQGNTPTDQIFRIDLGSHRAIPAGTFDEPLAESGVVVRGPSAYLAGGWTGTKYATAILKFTPPSGIALIGRLPVGLRSAAVALLGSTLYVAGGRTEHGLSREVYAVDLKTGKVSVFGRLPQALEQSVLVVATSGLFVLGGETAAGKHVRTVIRVDPVTGYATTVGTITNPFSSAAAVPAGERTIVVVAPAGTVYRVG